MKLELSDKARQLLKAGRVDILTTLSIPGLLKPHSSLFVHSLLSKPRHSDAERRLMRKPESRSSSVEVSGFTEIHLCFVDPVTMELHSKAEREAIEDTSVRRALILLPKLEALTELFVSLSQPAPSFAYIGTPLQTAVAQKLFSAEVPATEANFTRLAARNEAPFFGVSDVAAKAAMPAPVAAAVIPITATGDDEAAASGAGGPRA